MVVFRVLESRYISTYMFLAIPSKVTADKFPDQAVEEQGHGHCRYIHTALLFPVVVLPWHPLLGWLTRHGDRREKAHRSAVTMFPSTSQQGAGDMMAQGISSAVHVPRRYCTWLIAPCPHGCYQLAQWHGWTLGRSTHVASIPACRVVHSRLRDPLELHSMRNTSTRIRG